MTATIPHVCPKCSRIFHLAFDPTAPTLFMDKMKPLTICNRCADMLSPRRPVKAPTTQPTPERRFNDP